MNFSVWKGTRRAILRGGTATLLTTILGSTMVAAQDASKIAILPKTLINDVLQISIVEAAAACGIETERFASSTHVAVGEQVNIIETVIARATSARQFWQLLTREG